jgi:hypothetical protein
MLPQSAKLEIRPAEKSSSALASSADLKQAQAMLQRGEFALAIDSFRRALREKPDDADALNGLAVSYASLGRYDLSQGYFEMALAYAPTNLRIYRNLARSLESQGKAEEAAGILKEVALLQSSRTDSPAPQKAVQDVTLSIAQLADTTHPSLPAARSVALEIEHPAPASIPPRPVAPQQPRLSAPLLERRLTVAIPHRPSVRAKVDSPRVAKRLVASAQPLKPKAVTTVIRSNPAARAAKPKLQARLFAQIIDRTGNEGRSPARQEPKIEERKLFAFMRCLPLPFSVGKTQCSSGGA